MITRSKHKNKDCYVISSDRLSASVIPSPGGKIASLLDLASGYEHMAQRAGPVYREQPYDGVYVDAECTGFDDMFPTIDECHYETAPWKGVRLPDHGEVWSLPWEHEVTGQSIRMRVRGVRLPYGLEKTVSMPTETTLRLDYALTNDTDFAMDYLWAAHVMANIDEGTRVLLPRCCRTAMTTFSRSGRMGRYGDSVPWPAFTAPDGKPHRADIARPAAVADNEKYYFRDPLDEGWCAVRAPGGRLLALSFPVAAVPFLGILMNEQAFDDRYNIFLEPCSAPFDRVDIARLRGQGSSAKAHSRTTWHVCMTVDRLEDGEELLRVTEEGTVVKGKSGRPA
jgi:hypothetical protein